MMRYLLPKNGNFYKANLHCHSTCSDGHLSPQELKVLYKSMGYSVLAITDHEILLDHSYLDDDNFLTLHGYETKPRGEILERHDERSVHINLIAKQQHNITQVCYNPAHLARDNHNFEGKFAPHKSYLDTVKYTGDYASFGENIAQNVNLITKEANNNGFLCIYNHQNWSLDTLADILEYDGFFAMEIYNHFNELLGIEDYNYQTFLQLVRKGRKIFAVATDDNHNPTIFCGTHKPESWSGGGFVWIKAEKLDYSSIISALSKGDFYASTGPEFYELYIDENKLMVKSSAVKSISVATDSRKSYSKWKANELVESAEFELSGEEEFIIVTLTDEFGKKAVSQPYYLKRREG